MDLHFIVVVLSHYSINLEVKQNKKRNREKYISADLSTFNIIIFLLNEQIILDSATLGPGSDCQRSSFIAASNIFD